jgi:hypothetical protein
MNNKKGLSEESVMDEISSQLISNKSLTTTTTSTQTNQLLSQPMNGWSDDDRHENSSELEQTTGIKLLVEAANILDQKPLKCSKQLNGLLNNDKKTSIISPNNKTNICSTDLCSNNDINIDINSSHLCNTSYKTCCTSDINGCDINEQSVVHPFNNHNIDKDIKCLSRLNINSNNFNIINKFSNSIDNDIELSNKIVYVNYESEKQMPDIMRLIQKDLSEPYSIYTYRYFIHNWPHLCFLVSLQSIQLIYKSN